jgi:hypothetical protein
MILMGLYEQIFIVPTLCVERHWQRSSVVDEDAGASTAAFQRRSVGTMKVMLFLTKNKLIYLK